MEKKYIFPMDCTWMGLTQDIYAFRAFVTEIVVMKP